MVASPFTTIRVPSGDQLGNEAFVPTLSDVLAGIFASLLPVAFMT